MVISFFSTRVGLGSGPAVPVVPVAVLTSLLVLGPAFILGPARGAVAAAPALFGVAGLAVSRRIAVGAFGRAATGVAGEACIGAAGISGGVAASRAGAGPRVKAASCR